ncbi:MAG TPA: MarR family transcriptional regulator [Methanoregula sp.]|nr:MarR family transcriptional regulator [Methanoregula sp.]
MDRNKHVHIISAGEHIHTAYPGIFRTLPTITRTYVLADSATTEFSPNPETQRQRAAIRDAVAAVKELSGSLSIPFTSGIVYPPVYPSVRTILTKIHRENPGARFTLDLSGGSAALCTALFSFVPWLGGEVWSAFEGKVPRPVPLPDRSIRNLTGNPNYPAILAVLLRKNKTAKGIVTRPWLTRSYLYSQIWPFYSRSRTRKPKPDDPVIQYRGGRKPAENLSQATFSSFMTTLRNAGFIEEKQDEQNRREKAYRVTDSGETAFRFYADPAASSTVKLVLDDLQSGPGY